MRRLVMMFVLCVGLGIGVAGYTAAQDAATPGATSDLCASPGASPVAGDATPILTTGSPDAVATSVVENIEGGLDQVSCGTPAATPAS